MKLILFVTVVLFKFSRLSSAPADVSTDAILKNDDEKENQPGYAVAHSPNGLAYVSNDEDLGTTGVVFQFRRSIKSDNTEIEARRRSALDKGFMRFGRAGQNMMRFGRSPADEPEDDSVPTRMRKNDKNIMRFGRAGNMLRFGRSGGDIDPNEFDNNDADEFDEYTDNYLMRNADEKGNKILRLGRSSSEESNEENNQSVPEKSEERLGVKKNDKNIMRFGRAGNMLRFGRSGNMLRFGRGGNMLRFGRTVVQSAQPRQSRGNVMRFGKRGNMMRFGRSGNEFESRETRANSNDRNMLRLGRGVVQTAFKPIDAPTAASSKRLSNGSSRPQAITLNTRIYCEDDECLMQKNENQLLENEDQNRDRLEELFGNYLPQKQGYGEVINEK